MPLFLSKSDDVDLWLDPKISSYDAIDIINKRQNDEEVNFLAIIRNSLLWYTLIIMCNNPNNFLWNYLLLNYIPQNIYFQLSWHPVSPNVGAIKNQGNELIRKVELSANGKAINKSTTKSANIMMKWLKPNDKSEDIGIQLGLIQIQVIYLLYYIEITTRF